MQPFLVPRFIGIKIINGIQQDAATRKKEFFFKDTSPLKII